MIEKIRLSLSKYIASSQVVLRAIKKQWKQVVVLIAISALLVWLVDLSTPLVEPSAPAESVVLPFLRMLMLVTDGAGIFTMYTIAQYYKPRPFSWRAPVVILYVFFYVLTVVFTSLTISDLLVILQAPVFWATLPIVRGLMFRLPLTIAGLWMIHRQHAR